MVPSPASTPISRGPSLLLGTEINDAKPGFGAIGPGDMVEIDAFMSDEALLHQLRAGKYDTEQLPQQIELPKWPSDRHHRHMHQPLGGPERTRPPRSASSAEWKLEIGIMQELYIWICSAF